MVWSRSSFLRYCIRCELLQAFVCIALEPSEVSSSIETLVIDDGALVVSCKSSQKPERYSTPFLAFVHTNSTEPESHSRPMDWHYPTIRRILQNRYQPDRSKHNVLKNICPMVLFGYQSFTNRTSAVGFDDRLSAFDTFDKISLRYSS